MFWDIKLFTNKTKEGKITQLNKNKTINTLWDERKGEGGDAL